MPDHRREVSGALQARLRSLLQVRLSPPRVKLAINLTTNERVAIKIMNQKIDEAESDRAYEEKALELFLNELQMSL